MEAGSLQSIAYMFFQLVDEILHALPCTGLFDWAWRVDFCQWAHRKDFIDEHAFTDRPYATAILTDLSDLNVESSASASSSFSVGAENSFTFYDDGKSPITFTS